MTTQAEKAGAIRDKAQQLEEVHPMCQPATEDRREMEAARSRYRKRAFQIWKDVTGQDLTKTLTFTDAAGDLWALDAHVELRRVQKGEPNA